jgi:hypothetical protein
MANDPDDEVFNRAGTRYSSRLVPRSRRMKSAAWLGNLAVSLIGQQPDAPFASQDTIVVVDSRTNRTVLKRSGTEVAVAETLNELAVDLERLSIRQFRAKSDIGD